MPSHDFFSLIQADYRLIGAGKSIKGLRLLILFVKFDAMKKKEAYTVSDERKTGDLQAVSRTILPFARSILGQKGFVEVDMIANWDKIVGEELADYVFPQRIEFKRGEKTDGVLHVAVPGGAFALELQHREKLLLAKVNSYFGYCAVSRLKIIQNAEILPLAEKPVQRSEKNLVTREEENYIRQLSEDIQNPALQEIVEKLGRSVIGNNKDGK